MFGVDNEGCVVGCEIVQLADRVTNILRSHCDPPLECTTSIVTYEGKDLLLVDVAASASSVHAVRDHGPFIRANATNRSPKAAELEALFRRQALSVDLGT